MLRNAFAKGLRDLRRSFPIWAIGVAVMPVWLVLLLPSVQEGAAEVQRYIEIMPEAFTTMFLGEAGNFATPVGFIDAELFSFMAPTIFFAFGIGLAVRQIAGEEEQGTLSLLLAYPVTRGRLLLQKAAVVGVGVLALTIVQLVTLAVSVALVDVDVDLSSLLGGHISLFLLTLAVSGIAFAVGAATGNRGVAIGVAVIVALGSYLLNALAPLNDTIEPLQKASLFYYYGGAQPLREGVQPAYAAVLLVAAAVALVVAYVAFVRRDVRA